MATVFQPLKVPVRTKRLTTSTARRSTFASPCCVGVLECESWQPTVQQSRSLQSGEPSVQLKSVEWRKKEKTCRGAPGLEHLCWQCTAWSVHLLRSEDVADRAEPLRQWMQVQIPSLSTSTGRLRVCPVLCRHTGLVITWASHCRDMPFPATGGAAVGQLVSTCSS